MPFPSRLTRRGGNDKPYDQVHLGVGAISLGNVLVGLYCIWHAKPYPTPGDWFGQGTTSGDLGLVVSNDGMHFREPVKGHVYISKEESAVTPAATGWYPTILEQAHGILNAGEETRIYHGRWRNAKFVSSSIPLEKGNEAAYYREEYHAEVALATLPRDRWGALGLFPDATEGTVWSAPVTLPQGGCQLSLNADGAKGMRVEISDERFDLLSGYSADEAGFATGGGGLDCPVTWPQGSLEALGGQTVRFRIHLRKGDASPKLYALYLRA